MFSHFDSSSPSSHPAYVKFFLTWTVQYSLRVISDSGKTAIKNKSCSCEKQVTTTTRNLWEQSKFDQKFLTMFTTATCHPFRPITLFVLSSELCSWAISLLLKIKNFLQKLCCRFGMKTACQFIFEIFQLDKFVSGSLNLEQSRK